MALNKKTLGAKGFPLSFLAAFGTLWECMKLGRCLTFQDQSMLDSSPFTYIKLVPNVDNATKTSQFWWISLCSIFCKLLAKSLANWLKVPRGRPLLEEEAAYLLIRISSTAWCWHKSLYTLVIVLEEILPWWWWNRYGKGLWHGWG